MSSQHTTRGIFTTVRSDGRVELTIETTEVAPPEDDEVLVRVEASPINPSDLGAMLLGADVDTAEATGTPDRPAITARVPERWISALGDRIDAPMPTGNEGAGIVVEAGASEAAQALLGRTVAYVGGGMHSQLRKLRVSDCLVLPDDITPAEGASWYVNPLTVLGMVETMRMEGHKALVHTAAASNLGQMLQRLCSVDDVPLVNVVRKEAQETLLRGQGAQYVCNSSSASFVADLTDAIAATGATMVFDAVGGGDLLSRILGCMEAAALRNDPGATAYGTTVKKRGYTYGLLDPSPTQIHHDFGFAWDVGGWLLPSFLAEVGRETADRLRARVVAELKTTFASRYSGELSLEETLDLDAFRAYAKAGTGEKVLVNPSKA